MKRHTPITVTVLVITSLLLASRFHAAAQVSSETKAASGSTSPKESTNFVPSEAVRPFLDEAIESARLEDLAWSDFPEYREQMREFYARNDHALVWVSGKQPTSQALELINLFQKAELKGLIPEDYDATRWEPRVKDLAMADGGSVSEKAAHFDIALTVSAMRYISDLHGGRVSPVQFGLQAKEFDLAGFLWSRLTAATDVASGVEEAEPSFAGYRRTAQAFEHYLALSKQGEGLQIPEPTFPLKAGSSYAGISQLAERLRRLGDLEPDAILPDNPETYTEALANAVKHFQGRHGLRPDGWLTRETYDQLVTPLSQRAAQLQLTLERFRWLPEKLDSPLIVVNIPEFRLRTYEGHHVALTMKAIVGDAVDHPTPVFADRVQAVVFRPYWNVPESITKRELVAALKKHPGYLARQAMQVVDGRGRVVTSNRVNANTIKGLEKGTLWLRQQPGPANALGLVKFVFPNLYGIYMHGTPERGLFGRARRDLSHGCIRVEDPAGLAAWVLRDDPLWTLPRVKAAMHGTDSVTVTLPHSVPILILYGTAVVEENGEVHFFNDIYGVDAALAKSLEQRRPR